MNPPPGLVELSLDDRYTADHGPALISGTQALVRLLIEQRRLDLARGLNTGVFVSGYPGSPLGGLDREIGRARAHLDPLGVVFEPGVNEELAATAVSGTQLVGELPGRTRDGVVGFWYGKAPGLDRAADAIRHGNVSGTSHLGGAVALIGDDPLCKSSTLPSSCELMAESLMLPLLSPVGVGDIVRLGLHAVALSRSAGMWTAIKIVADVADASVAVSLQDWSSAIPAPPAEGRGGPPMLLGASSVAAEHDLMSRRVKAARDYGRAHRLNRVVHEPPLARTALIAPGAAFATVRRALHRLGIGDAELDELGVRLVSLELVWPLHRDDVVAFADGVQEIVVVEDKRPFVERQLRDLLYGGATAPRILGSVDATGRPLLGMAGAVDVDGVAGALAGLWSDRLSEPVRRRQATTADRRSAPANAVARTPFFCSGCPHNLSTLAPADQLVGAGIGCHSLIWLDAPGRRGNILGAPQMGGEGAQWLGMAPFTEDRHYLQNIGDGTFHHSGSLAIRAAVASGRSITFRLLYNDAIAMTGGQTPAGRMAIPDLAGWLLLEGVAQVIITTEDVDSFASASLPDGVTVRDRSRLAAAERELAAVDGVTVLIHADRCATEERRLRKRGRLPVPAQRVWINERVCEGCGDCGDASSCLSVVPVETELGRRTQIHQSSCTQDLACLAGDCPSFVLVTPGERAPAAVPSPPLDPPEPESRFGQGAHVMIRMPGIGGTGVVTVSQILQMAALLDGRWAGGLDQTGLAQKGGPVISDVRIGPEPDPGALRAAAGEVDVLLGLDLLGSVASDTLRSLDPARTVAIVNTQVTATASMVTDPSAPRPTTASYVDRIERATHEARFLDAGALAQALFADHMPANVIMLGAAYQHGCVPVRADAIHRAIQLNGASVDANLSAFEWGRAAAAAPGAVAEALAAHRGAPVRSGLSGGAPPPLRRMIQSAGPGPELAELLDRRIADLAAYQDTAYARRYLDDVLSVLALERRRGAPDRTPVTEAYARAMHRLMAYKDEYEVARLHLDPIEQARMHEVFGPDATVEILLHPPMLRALGLTRKLRLGVGARPLLRGLAAARRLRGTALDPFGHSNLRRLERALVDEHRRLAWDALASLTPANQDEVARIVGLSDLIRGYEEIKLRNVARYRAAVADARATLITADGDGFGSPSAMGPSRP